MRDIVINCCFGGFGLSDMGIKLYGKLAGIILVQKGKYFYNGDKRFYVSDIERDDPYLVGTVKELCDMANDTYSKLKIVSIPEDVNWVIEEYDGSEWVSEKHRTWHASD